MKEPLYADLFQFPLKINDKLSGFESIYYCRHYERLSSRSRRRFGSLREVKMRLRLVLHDNATITPYESMPEKLWRSIRSLETGVCELFSFRLPNFVRNPLRNIRIE